MESKKLKKTELHELNEAYNRALIWFFSYPNEGISLSELKKNIGTSKTTASKIVRQLVNEGFLVKEVLGRVWRIRSVPTHHYNITKKIAYNLEMIYKSGVINEIHDIIQNPLSITLFGSYRKGDDTEKSDIDIAVEILGNADVKVAELGIIPVFGYRKNVKVNLHIFSRNKIDLILFSNIANGIVIEGFLEVRP